MSPLRAVRGTKMLVICSAEAPSGGGGGLSLISLGGKGRNVPFLTKIMITSQREKEIYTVTTEKIISHESYE